MRVGFIGLGQMGTGMAESLLRAGHEVTVYNRTRARAEALVQQGATVAAGVGDACRGDAVFTMLADDDAVRHIAFDEGGILESLPKGATHISSSTISVALSEALEAAHADAGQTYVSAPVFGRPEVAAAGNLFVVAAGTRQVVDSVSPLLDAVGQRTFVVAEIPKAANLVKLSGNFLIASVIESLGEAMTLVGKTGIDRHQYLDVLTSTLFDAPVYRIYGGMLADRKFEPAGFSAALGRKDIALVLAAGDDLCVSLPFASVLRDRFLTLLARGGEALDWSAIGGLVDGNAGVDSVAPAAN